MKHLKLTAKDLASPYINQIVANKLKAQTKVWLRTVREVTSSDQVKNKLRKHSKEKWQDPEFRKKRNKSLNAWAKSDQRREQVSTQMTGKPKSKKHRQNMSQSQKEFYKTPEGKMALASKSAKQKGQKRPIVTCPHCGKQGADRIMGRWHFDNCKQKK